MMIWTYVRRAGRELIAFTCGRRGITQTEFADPCVRTPELGGLMADKKTRAAKVAAAPPVRRFGDEV